MKFLQYADVSTLHIRREDLDLLEGHRSSSLVLNYEEGAWVYSHIRPEDFPGLSEQFWRVLEKVWACCGEDESVWVRFDCDGEEYPDLERCEW